MRKILFTIIIVLFSKSINAQWCELGGLNSININYGANALVADKLGNIYLAAQRVDAVARYPFVLKWDGMNWKQVGSFFNEQILCLFVDGNNNIYAGGSFKNAAGKYYLARYNGTSWVEYGGNNSLKANGAIYSICQDNNGNILAGGDFRNANGKRYIAKYNGSTWSELGGNNSLAADNFIHAICNDKFGNIYTAGGFSNGNGMTYIAKYDGSTWINLDSSLATGSYGYIYSILADSAGNIYVSRQTSKSFVTKFDGVAWSIVGGSNGIFSGDILNMCFDKKMNLYVSGQLSNSDPMKFNGILWDTLSNTQNIKPTGRFYAMCIDSIGNVYVSGNMFYGEHNYVAKYQNYSLINVEGKIVTPFKKPVKNSAFDTTDILFTKTLSDTSGFYNFKLPNGNYTIRPTKNNDITKANGINSVDALLVQRHILNANKLKGAYKLIAADVDGNKVINSVDVLRIKRLILGTDTTFTKTVNAVKTDRLWEFVDSAYQFPDTTNPFPFKDSISFTNLTSNKTNQTFIGVKLGDVNDSWNPVVARGVAVNSVELIVDSEKKTSTIDYHFSTKNFKDIAALQYTLHFDNTKYEFVNLEGFKNLQGFEYNAAQANTTGNIAMLWTDKNAQSQTLEDGTELFTLILKTKTNSRATNDLELTLTNNITAIEAWDNDYKKHNIVLLQKTSTKDQEPKIKDQLVVYPNPATSIVNIECGSAKQLLIIDYLGRIIHKQIINNKSNILNIKLAKGVYIVQATMQDGSVKNEKLIIE